MNLKSIYPPSSVKYLAQILLLALCLAAPVFAEEKYLATGHLDGIALLPAPPTLSSAEQIADLNSARAIFKSRTPTDEANAFESAKLSLFHFAPAIGSFFQPGKFPKMELFYQNFKPEIKAAIDEPKNHWKRQRPYQVDTNLWLGKPEPSFGYPSGHSSVGTVQSLFLAELFPEKRDAILQIGRSIGWDRVIIGKHFPTDIYAGRVLGQAIFRELLASPAFQHDLAEVKAEVQIARQVKLEEIKSSR